MPFDFGQHPVEVAGSVRRVPFVASVFPESTRRVPFACPAEDERCLFDAIECADRKAGGGIADRSTLEDTKLLVAKMLEGHLREETEAEKRFRVLLGVTPRFTNVSAGSEKGHVEGTVGRAKRHVLPDIEVASSEELGKAPDEACEEDPCEEDARTRRHGPERKLLEELFEEEGSSCGRRDWTGRGEPDQVEDYLALLGRAAAVLDRGKPFPRMPEWLKRTRETLGDEKGLIQLLLPVEAGRESFEELKEASPEALEGTCVTRRYPERAILKRSGVSEEVPVLEDSEPGGLSSGRFEIESRAV